MKKNKLIVLLSFCMAISAYAQNNENRVNELVKVLI
jgi:hypothetical protein